MDLSVTSREEDGRTVVEVSGEIDLYTAPSLRERLNIIIGAGRHHLVLDLEGVAFLDSSGLGVLVGGLRRVRSHDGSLHLVCQREKIIKVFRVAGLTEVFSIHDTVADAIAASTSADRTNATSRPRLTVRSDARHTSGPTF